MSSRDTFALIVSLVYPTVLLLVAELLRRYARVSPDLTRKFVHVGAGMWTWGALALFESPWWRVVPFTAFILINYLNYRTRLVRSVETGGAGTVWFALSCALLFLILAGSSQPTTYVVFVGLMAMTWGDAAAALIGQPLGRHPYHVYPAGRAGGRSVEGSAAMLLVSAVAISLTLFYLNANYFGSSFATATLLAFALLLAVCATLIEAVTAHGLDNMTVPLLTSGLGWLLLSYPEVGWRLALGLAVSGAIGLFSYRQRSLSLSGVLGAVVTGSSIFAFGGWSWGLLLIVFFVTATLLSHYRKRDKEQLETEKFDKGGTRDWGQAIANGGVAVAFALVHLLDPRPLWLAAFVAALATVNADTWATELGILSKRPPRSITTGKLVTAGTSGGVTALGTGAAAAGGLLIGLAMLLMLLVHGLFQPQGLSISQLAALPLVALVGGLAGAMFDSLLGATMQVMYYAPGDEKETEKRIAGDGTPNTYRRGLRWLNNDAVNAISSIVGAIVGAAVFSLWLAVSALFRGLSTAVSLGRRFTITGDTQVRAVAQPLTR